MSDDDLDDLRAELDEYSGPEKTGGRPPREERIIAGFEDIQRFFETHHRAPQHGEGRDIFERLYAVRLDRLRTLPDCRAILEPLDHQGLLAGGSSHTDARAAETADDDELVEELRGIGDSEITALRHVRSSEERQGAEEIANRVKCEEFETFKPLFQKVQRELDSGQRETRPFQADAEIRLGEFFILGGQKVYVAEFGEEFRTEQGRRNARLRLIFDNGTESRGLLRSFQCALYDKENAGRRITDPNVGPLFEFTHAAEGKESGTIYVLRSKSELPQIAQNRDVIHKIGVTGGDMKSRLSNAKLDPTFLLADVEVVATYTLFGIERTKLEALLHKFFSPARLDLEIKDRFGNLVRPREWFLVPLSVIDEVVERIKNESLVGFFYDLQSASLRPLAPKAQ